MPWSLLLALAGSLAAIGAAFADPGGAAAAAGQTWPAFVLVAGLLLIGLVAASDGLFAAAGERLAAAADRGVVLYSGLVVLLMAVTAVLNLDTSVAFLTPVAVHTARSRGEDGSALLAACLLLSNAGSLLLPGSNLTNLIVLGSRHVSGLSFMGRMALPWVVAGAVTATVVGLSARRELGRRVEVAQPSTRPVLGVGAAAVAAGVVLVIALPDPAPWVLAVGVASVAWRVAGRRFGWREAVGVLGVPVLVGLFGAAVALGALGRAWSGAAQTLNHLGPWATAGAGGAASVLVNNLPAAALLSARPPAQPLALLIGLDVGPNLFFTGSLAWVLWYRSGRAAGGRPRVRRTVLLGLVSAPLAGAAAVAALVATGAAR